MKTNFRIGFVGIVRFSGVYMVKGTEILVLQPFYFPKQPL